jgi:hypothetical protein
MTDLPERSRGRYRYSRDGVELGLDERFVAGDIGGSVVRVRSTRIGARPTFRLAADVRHHGGVRSAELRWTGSDPAVAAAGTARYRVTGPQLTVEREVDGDSFVESAQGRLLPLLRVFAGPVIRAAVAADPIAVVVPDLREPADPARLLAPLADRRQAEVVAEVEHQVDGRPVAAVVYRLTGGSYGEVGAQFTVDAGGLLLGYDWDQPGSGRWQVRLADVTGPWPAPASW